MINPLTPDRRLLRYMGAKNFLAPWILKHFPEHEVYVEPFFGSGAILYNKARSPYEIISDTNGNIVNFFTVLRDRPDELIEQIRFTPYAEEEFKKTPVLFDAEEVAALSDLERARLFYVWSWMCFYPHTSRAKQPFRIIKGDGSGNYSDLAPLEFMAERLSGNLQILNQPAGEVISKMVKGKARNLKKTLFYCDPPYVPETRSDKNGTYSDEMSYADHQAFCELLLKVPLAVVSGYDNPLYNEAFADWTKVQKNATKMARNPDGTAVRSVETLYISPGCGIFVGEQTELPLAYEQHEDRHG